MPVMVTLWLSISICRDTPFCTVSVVAIASALEPASIEVGLALRNAGQDAVHRQVFEDYPGGERQHSRLKPSCLATSAQVARIGQTALPVPALAQPG
jgi:hypothetical protein